MSDSSCDSQEEFSIVSPISILAKEIKEIRNKIMTIKKSVTKGDKKQKKVIQDEINVLENELKSKEEELKSLKLTAEIKEQSVEDFEVVNKINKARLKKDRRKEEKAAEWEANRQAALTEISNRPDFAKEESKAFTERLNLEGFKIIEIAADGHCLFSAIGCQLNPPQDHWQLRKLAAEYLKKNRNEFENFIELDCFNGDDVIEEDSFDYYCKKLESTGMWGGQVELEALSKVLGISITILQSEGSELNFNYCESEKECLKGRIYLSYHRHAYSLGEHYNALSKIE